MAEQYIQKECKRKNPETGNLEAVLVNYRIDIDFVPNKLDEICEEFICNYCSTDEAKQDWLCEQYNKEVEYIDKDTKETKKRRPTFTELRKVFVAQYFKHLVAKKKKSPREEFLAKYGKKK